MEACPNPKGECHVVEGSRSLTGSNQDSQPGESLKRKMDNTPGVKTKKLRPKWTEADVMGLMSAYQIAHRTILHQKRDTAFNFFPVTEQRQKIISKKMAELGLEKWTWDQISSKYHNILFLYREGTKVMRQRGGQGLETFRQQYPWWDMMDEIQRDNQGAHLESGLNDGEFEEDARSNGTRCNSTETRLQIEKEPEPVLPIRLPPADSSSGSGTRSQVSCASTSTGACRDYENGPEKKRQKCLADREHGWNCDLEPLFARLEESRLAFKRDMELLRQKERAERDEREERMQDKRNAFWLEALSMVMPAITRLAEGIARQGRDPEDLI